MYLRKMSYLFFKISLCLVFLNSYAQQEEFAEDEFIVQISAEAAQMISFKFDGNISFTEIPEINTLNIKYKIYSILPVLRFTPKSIDLAEKYGLTRTFIFKIPLGTDILSIVDEYNSLPSIEYAEPNYIINAADSDDKNRSNLSESLIPNDPFYSEEWSHDNQGQVIPAYGGNNVGTIDCDMDTPEAWDITTGSDSVIISILDTGVDYNHPEFSTRIVSGYDFINNDNDPMDDNGHGTACAGIAGAEGNNGMGIAGVNWDCLIMPIKVLDANGNGYYSQIINGITFAADQGSRVLSISLGGSSYSSSLENAVNYAYGLDCVLFAARMNDNNTAPRYPASFTNVIAIGALSPCDERKSPTSCDGENWWGSSYGNDLDFVAPGTRIYTTDILGEGGYSANDFYPYFNGTSAATPHAAGLGALLRSYYSSMTNAQIRELMRQTCVDMEPSGFDIETGYGRINAYYALLGYLPHPPKISIVPLSFNFNIQQGDSIVDVLTIYNTAGDSSLNLEWFITEENVTLGINSITVPNIELLMNKSIWQTEIDKSVSDNSREFNKIAPGGYIKPENLPGITFTTEGMTGTNTVFPTSVISLILDDGSKEAHIGFPGGGQGIWLNRFTPDSSDFPFTLNEIWVMYGSGINVGELVDIYLYEDNDGDGDPGSGAIFKAAFNDAPVQAIGAVFSVYSIPPVVFHGPHDVIIGVVNRTAGINPGDYPAALDRTSSAGRSWIGTYFPGDPPDPPGLPSNGLWGIIDTFGWEGNWLIRGYGISGDIYGWVTEYPISGIISPGSNQNVNIKINATGLDPGIYTRNLVINSNDPDDNPIVIPVTLSVEQSTVSADYNIAAGWNMLSLPLEVSDAHYRTLFPNSIEGTLFGYSGGYFTTETVGTCTGYWLKFPAPEIVDVYGLEITECVIDLDLGWNMIGGSNCDVPLGSVVDPGGIIIPGTLFGYAGGYFTATSIDATKGYWIKASLPGTITIGCGAALAKGGNDLILPLETLTDFAKIDISDANNKGQILYFNGKLDEGISIESYSMPPVSPKGSFDARLTGSYRLSESDVVTIQVQSSSYPLKVKIEGKGQEYIVKQLIGTNEIDEKIVASGEELTISNSKVNKLRILKGSLIPTEFVLYQNYPNPFNPVTQIKYGIPKAERVELTIFNVLGEQVATLVNQEQEAGYYTVEWSGSNVSSGVYLYTLKAGDNFSVKKMILLK